MDLERMNMTFKLTLTPTGAKPIIAAHIGSVVDVIAGHVPNPLKEQRYSAHDYQYGFEIASPENFESLGEAILVNGYCFSRSTNSHASDFYKTLSGENFVTSGIFLIPLNAKPTYQVDVQFDKVCSLDKLYHELFAQIKQPFALTGFVNFTQLHIAAIAKPPIHDQNIFDHAAMYYPFPSELLTEGSAFIVGAVADYNDPKLKSILNQLEVVLYRNPFDKQHALTTHAHGVTLNQDIKQVSDITPAVVDEVIHVFSDKSELTSFRGEIFVIDAMQSLASKR
jgi:hypothetical protein